MDNEHGIGRAARRGLRGLHLLLTCAALTAAAQTSPGTWWVRFSDKAHTPYSLSAPQEYLSPRALERRARQGIAIDELDLPVDPAYIQALLSAGDFELLLVSKWFNAVTIRTTDQAAVDSLLQLPFVAQVKRSNDGRPRPLAVDKEVPLRRLFEEDYGLSFRQLEMMNGHLLQEIGGARGEGMLIGVLDSGFDRVNELPGFRALRDRNGVRATRDLVDRGGDVYYLHNHGRMVLSLMAGHIPDTLAGSAPMADYVLVRTENAFSEYLIEEDNWVSGAEYCDSLGCDVLNTSLGYSTFDDSLQDHTYADMNGHTTRISIAAGIAADKGMVPVNSAGNAGDNSWHYITAPADAEGVLTVGAVRADRTVATFSSRGPSADGRIKPDVAAQGQAAIGLGWDPYVVSPINGTSFSSPLVAGLTACLWQLHPQVGNRALMDAIRRSASHAHAPNDSIGFGIPDFWRAHLLLGGRDLTGLSAPQVLSVAPVPFSTFMDLEVYSGSADRVVLSLHDLAGRAVWNATRPVEPGTFTLLRLEDDLIRSLPVGAYVLQARIGEDRLTRRVVRAIR